MNARLLVALTSLVAAVGYLGAVTPVALVAFVLPASLLGSAAALTARRPLRGLVPLVVTSGGWAVVVNALSGTTQGPAARSSAVAALFSGLAVLALLLPAPALFLVPVVLVLGGALSLGAGGEVTPVALGVVVAAVLALRAVTSEQRRWLTVPRQAGVVLLGLLFALGGGGLALLLEPPRTPLVLFPGQTDPGVSAGLPDLVPQQSARPTPPPAPSPTPSARPVPRVVPASHPVARVLEVVLLVLLVLALAVLGRLLWVSLAWRRLRRRYDSGDPATATAGAWPFLRAGLGRYGVVLPPALAPGGALPDLPDDARAAVEQLAPLVERAAFGRGDVPPQVHDTAWAHADAAATAVRVATGRWARARGPFRSPVRPGRRL